VNTWNDEPALNGPAQPILEALGWDIRDWDEVHREYRGKSVDSPVDYALKIMRTPRLFLEAKGLGEDLSDRKWVAQVLGYATVAGGD
jgi:predicted type IV restriction endonuclease